MTSDLQKEIAYVGIESEREAFLYVEHFERWSMQSAQDDPPHRHDFHEVIWFESGAGQHIVDQHMIEIQARHLCMVARGQVHLFKSAQELSGYLVCFRDEFVTQASGHVALFNTASAIDLEIDDMSFELGSGILRLLLSEYERPDLPARAKLLHQLTLTFLTLVERVHHRQLNYTPIDYGLYRRFLELLEIHYASHHEVLFYANLLSSSAGQLSKLVQQAVNKSVKQVILERLMLEAKRFLRFGQASIKEIAFTLGFSDPYHFSKAFKSQVGIAPFEYRKTHSFTRSRNHMI